MLNMIYKLMFVLMFTVPLFSHDINKAEFHSIKEYKDLLQKNNIVLTAMDSLGYAWTTKGMFYFSDYKFDDGYVKADLPKAEECFEKAIKRGDTTAYYLLAATKLKMSKPREAMNICKSRLDKIFNYKSNNKLFKRDLSMLANMYAGIVLYSLYSDANAKQAITYIFDSAHKEHNNRSELYLGLLYHRIGKKKISNYYLSEACVKNENKTKYVVNYCNKNFDIGEK